MPLKDIDYSKTIIYKMVCKDINIKDCYVGSTTDFIRRRSAHKNNTNNNTKDSHSYVYEFIRQNNGWDNWEMIEVEKYNAVDKNDSLKRERYWLETLKATLNKVIPTRKKKEYREINEDKIKEHFKEYYENNKDKVKEIKKEYYEKNKFKFKDMQKSYREKHRDIINETERLRRLKKKQLNKNLI